MDRLQLPIRSMNLMTLELFEKLKDAICTGCAAGAVPRGYSGSISMPLSGHCLPQLPFDQGMHQECDVVPPRAYVPEKVDNVFFWPVALHTGKNVVMASDGQGHTDTATIYFYGKDGLPEMPSDPLLISGLTSSNAGNPAYYMNMPIHEQWPIYYDFDSNADNSWNAIPPQSNNATWIALRRVTVQAGPPTKHDPKPTLDQSTDLSFTATKAENIYIMATQMDAPPAFATRGQFKEVSPGATTLWRNNDLLLVPAQLYVHVAAAGEKISDLPLGDRDAIVMIDPVTTAISTSRNAE